MDKLKYYSNKDVVKSYYEKRYGGKSGKFIIKRELREVQNLLPEKGKILDLACGLGRLNSILSSRHKVVGVDGSKSMLENCVYKNKVLASVTNLPFKEEFDIVVILRLLFHYGNIEEILKEASRVTKKDGIIIFETYRWSPKMFLDTKKLGGKAYIHSDRKIKKLLRKYNLKFINKSSIALFSPYIQKRLPISLVKFFYFVEKILPKKFLVDVYWKVQKI